MCPITTADRLEKQKLWRSDWSTIAIRNDTRDHLEGVRLVDESYDDILRRMFDFPNIKKEWKRTGPRSISTKKNMSDARKNQWLKENVRQLMHEKIVESLAGGFWYGNIKYDDPKYCEKFNAEFRERVRAYFGYRCFECGIPQNGKKLHIHHVHYDKKMCCNGSPQDCVPLCHSCHASTNNNRDYWETHFTELLYAIHPNGKCFFTKEEMEIIGGRL